MDHAWIAVSDDEVATVLEHPDLHTRPVDEPVPAPILGTLFGEVYARLVRMNDGARHAALRRIVEARLGTWNLDVIGELSASAAKHFPPRDIAPFVLGTMIGMKDPASAVSAIWDFARAVAGSASGDELLRGIPATEYLLEQLRDDEDLDIRANLLGFLFQSATTIATMLENRLDGETRPPVPFTRRWAATDLEVCGRTIRRGELVVVLLLSPRFSHGEGRHRCPGDHVAHAIVDGAMRTFTSVAHQKRDRSPAHQPA